MNKIGVYLTLFVWSLGRASQPVVIGEASDEVATVCSDGAGAWDGPDDFADLAAALVARPPDPFDVLRQEEECEKCNQPGGSPLAQQRCANGHWFCARLLKQWQAHSSWPCPWCQLEDALRSAAGAGDCLRVGSLLEAAVNVNARNPTTGMTPLMCAVLGQHVDCAKRLLDEGLIDPLEQDSRGRTALMWAVRGNSLPCVALLLAWGEVHSFVDSLDDCSLTALDYAVLGQNQAMVDAIRRAGGAPGTSWARFHSTRWQ